MMKRYGTSITIMVIFLVGLIFGVTATSSWSSSEENDVKVMDGEKTQANLREQISKARLAASAQVWPTIKEFNKSWEPYVQPFTKKTGLKPGAKMDVAQAAMDQLERDAQAVGVGSSQKTLPAVSDYRLGTRSLRVQKISLTATGELSHCLAWLGSIQEHMPYSRVESFTLSGFGSSGSSLQVTVALPVTEAPKMTAAAATPPPAEK